MKLYSLFSCIVFLTTVTGTHAAKYISPDESKELFKVEKIPLQVDSMRELSKHLTALACREQDDSSTQRRGTAQMLAVAMRLNSANQLARETDQAMRKNESVTAPAPDAILKAKSRLRFFQRWLSNPDAGTDANALALYIADATRVLNTETLNAAEQANWSNILPAPTVEPAPAVDKTPPPVIAIPDKPPVTDKTSEESPYKISELTVMMPLTMDTLTKYKDANDRNKEKIRRTSGNSTTPVKLSIEQQKGPLSLTTTSSLAPGNGPNDKVGFRKALLALQTRLGTSAANAKVNVTIGNRSSSQYSASNDSAAAAAVELMLAASKAGINLRPDLHLCAAIDSQGKLHLPKNFWSVMKALRAKNGTTGRLIIPKASMGILTQILVFGEPEFFTRWEVIGVDTIEQALTYAAVDTDPKVAEAEQLFLSIRNLSNKEPVTKITVNKAVRTRLSEISSLTPDHLSAQLLLLQGGGKRPIRLNSLGIAHEIYPSIKKMTSSLAQVNKDNPKPSDIIKIHEAARADLDPLQRLISSSDNAFYKQALDIANDLRSLHILIKRNQRTNSKSNPNKAKVKAMTVSIKANTLKLKAALERTINSSSGK